jgi:Ca2+-binding EF-hand superfamily protein
MTDKTPRREKHSETLEVRLPYSVKAAFMEACQEKGVTASEAVRNFVGTYPVRRRGILPSINLFENVEFRMNMFVVPVIALGVLAGSVSTDDQAVADYRADDENFAELDQDLDGFVNLDEFRRAAGLEPGGHLGNEMRQELTQSLQLAIAEYGPYILGGVTADTFISDIITDAEFSANESINTVFAEIDADGDGRMSFVEYAQGPRR